MCESGTNAEWPRDLRQGRRGPGACVPRARENAVTARHRGRPEPQTSTPESIPNLNAKGTRLEGKPLVFAGELDSLTREQAAEAVIQQAGRVSERVSRQTDFLVVGSSPGGTKTQDAREFGTKTLSEFLRLIGRRELTRKKAA